MDYKELENLSDGEFKRLCGVTRGTFADMVAELRPLLERCGQRGGQPKLTVENQLLVALEYWREYRTHFHIGVSWSIHETTVGRIIHKVEDRLAEILHLSQQGTLLTREQEFEALKTAQNPATDIGARFELTNL